MKIYTMFESIILSKIMHAPIDAVWAVITETNHLKIGILIFQKILGLK